MPFVEKQYLEGLADVLRKLDELPKRLRNKHLKKAVGNAARTILWAAKARTPKRRGVLYKSLGRKVKLYRNSGVAVAIVGARTGFRQVVGTRVRDSRPGTKYPKKAGDPIYADPTKYLHLVELGTSRSAGVHMLRDAIAQNKAAIADEMRKALEDAVKEAAAS